MTTAIKIDDELEGRVRRLADQRQRSAHRIMYEAVRQYVEREEQREVFRQEVLKAWDEYQATGLHATTEEVDAWLATWGTENELPAPVCYR